ncbi:ribonuclease H2 subunit A [Nematocida homosporus]|uniref:ribonuclease H2 subunit A n=1 Tax=Nematocida homosporus TaxID=1912981 RepID=UPI00221EC562|nr:ribonuclease H2 subunit A [Nematocida homosporus]KAI5185778.1 ribonuclease H2 subunit A [Nematocida homosporus]
MTESNSRLAAILAGLNIVPNKDITIEEDEYGNIFVVKMPIDIKPTYELGIDEAGRGPLAGHLVYTALFWEASPITHYRDSKLVSISRRTEQYLEICSQMPDVGFVACGLSPLFISLNMLNHMRDVELVKARNRLNNSRRAVRQPKPSKNGETPIETQALPPTEPNPCLSTTNSSSTPIDPNPLYISPHRYNLNEISLQCVSQILSRYILNKIPVTRIFMDALGPIKTAEETIRKAMSGAEALASVVVEKKADTKYQVVSAASIIAKSIRDRLINDPGLQSALYGQTYTNLGSGYPSDPITRSWLKNAFIPVIGVPPIVRCSWKPVLDFLKEHRPATDPNTPPIGTLSLLCAKPQSESGQNRP